MTDSVSKEEVLGRIDQKIINYLEISGNCAQSSFLVLAEEFGLEGGSVLKALTPFPGFAYRGQLCGTVVGCMMAIGLAFGREKLEDWGGYIHSIPPARAFFHRFEKEVGSMTCSDLIESEFGDRFESVEPAETKRLLQAGAIEKCSKVIGKGVRIAAEIILDRER